MLFCCLDDFCSSLQWLWEWDLFLFFCFLCCVFFLPFIFMLFVLLERKNFGRVKMFFFLRRMLLRSPSVKVFFSTRMEGEGERGRLYEWCRFWFGMELKKNWRFYCALFFHPSRGEATSRFDLPFFLLYSFFALLSFSLFHIHTSVYYLPFKIPGVN